MKSFGFTLLTILLVGALIAGGYFALATLKSPASYIPTESEAIGDLYKIKTEPDTGISNVPVQPVVVTETPTPAPTPTAPADDKAGLIAKINDMISRKITLKSGSRGVDVGTVQTFMNLYFKKTTKPDNDFGKTTEANVKTFQTQNKLPVTGQVAGQTMGKMVEWLNNH